MNKSLIYKIFSVTLVIVAFTIIAMTTKMQVERLLLGGKLSPPFIVWARWVISLFLLVLAIFCFRISMDIPFVSDELKGVFSLNHISKIAVIIHYTLLVFSGCIIMLLFSNILHIIYALHITPRIDRNQLLQLTSFTILILFLVATSAYSHKKFLIKIKDYHGK